MKTTTMMVALMVMPLLTMGALASAEDTLTGKALTKATAKQSETLPDVTGKVQDVDTGANVIQVKADSSYTRIVKVDSSTEILKDGQPVRVADVAEGDTVTLHSTSVQ